MIEITLMGYNILFISDAPIIYNIVETFWIFHSTSKENIFNDHILYFCNGTDFQPKSIVFLKQKLISIFLLEIWMRFHKTLPIIIFCLCMLWVQNDILFMKFILKFQKNWNPLKSDSLIDLTDWQGIVYLHQ